MTAIMKPDAVIAALKPYAVPAGAILCLWPAIGPALALLLGIAVALTCGNAYGAYTKQYTSRLLSLSVIGLGAGMNLNSVLQAGASGIGYTAISIILCMAAGLLIGRFLKTDREASTLITVGTAICGGSAIAAIAPAIHAKDQTISVALAVVFCLNALALLIFPWVGHMAGLTEYQFGLWAALAIHDTSSVVGAGLKYGPDALETAVTVKLARALWIVPLAFAVQALYARGHAPASGHKPKYPWFIIGFLAMAGLVTYVPALAPFGDIIGAIARQLLVVTLFLIGTGLSADALKTVGIKPMVQGIVLWLAVASASLCAIHAGWIH